MSMYDDRCKRPSRPGRLAERGFLRRIGRETGGSALLEFGLTIPIILMVFFGIVEFGSLSFARITVRHAVVEATRFAVTGNQLTDPDDDQVLLSRIASIQRMVHDRATHVTIQNISVNPADGGGPEEIVTITVDFTYNYFLPGFKDVLDPVDFSVSTSMRNEPFLPSGEGA
jgi:hypothetical protein